MEWSARLPKQPEISPPHGLASLCILVFKMPIFTFHLLSIIFTEPHYLSLSVTAFSLMHVTV